MAGLFDSLGALFAGGGHAPQAVGQPLIQALLAKHSAALPDLGEAGKAVGDVAAGPRVGSDVSSPEARTANVFDQLPAADTPKILGAGGDSPIKDALAANAAKPQGFLDRIGSFLHSNEGRAEAMRFAAGAFKGGMAGGLDAATSFADQRHHEAAASASDEADRALKTRELDDNHDWHMGQVDNEAVQNAETVRHNRAGEQNTAFGTNSENWRHATPSGDARTQSQTSIYTHLNPSGDTLAGNAERRFEHLTPSGDTTATQAGENYRNDHPPLAPVTPPTLSMHAHYTTTPQDFARDGPRLRPSQVQPGDAGSPVRHVANDDQYNALPSGAKFMGPDGQVRVKP